MVDTRTNPMKRDQTAESIININKYETGEKSGEHEGGNEERIKNNIPPKKDRRF